MIKVELGNLPVLCGDKIVLRPIRDADTELIVKWRNNDRVRNNFIYRGPFTEAIHNQWMQDKVKTGEVIQYIIEYGKTPVGSVYYRDLDYQNNSAEFGIFIGEDNAIGKGVGKESIPLFLTLGFQVLGLHRVSLRHLAQNEIAHRLYLKTGFREEGCFKDLVFLDGQYHDVVFMAVIDNKPED